MIKRLYWFVPLFFMAADAVARGRAVHRGWAWWEFPLLMLVTAVVVFLPFMLIFLAIDYRQKIAAGFAGVMKRVCGRVSPR